MKFIDLNNREHTFELDTNFAVKSQEQCRSEPQFQLGRLLCKHYGKNNVFEDYPLPGCNNLSWDFWVPHMKIAFEFHGKQHFEYVKFFHQTKAGLRNQQTADLKKEAIATANGVKLIVLTEKDFSNWTKEELVTAILNRIQQ